MTMLKSLKVQDHQQEARMNKHRLKVVRDYQRRETSVQGSPTQDWVCRVCESQLGQNCARVKDYLFHLVSREEIQVVHNGMIGDVNTFCEDCSDSFQCASCQVSSPVMKFKRIRTLTIKPYYDAEGKHVGYEVECTCKRRKFTGIPCVHFSIFLQVRTYCAHCDMTMSVTSQCDNLHCVVTI